jgi:hypothetical protein
MSLKTKADTLDLLGGLVCRYRGEPYVVSGSLVLSLAAAASLVGDE